MLPRPRISLPLWSVPVIVAALYVVRSLLHGSWRLQLPTDALVLALAAIVMAAVAELRSSLLADGRSRPSDADGASRTDAGGPEV